MIWNTKQHSYEEIREAIVDIVVGRISGEQVPSQWIELLNALGREFERRESSGRPFIPGQRDHGQLHPVDMELARDAFWDLFRQGMITLGLNNSNPQWPFFRLSHLGERELRNQSPLRFYDSESFLILIRNEVPDIGDDAIAYLREASGAFYSDLLLSATVMLGVAAESEFLRLIDVAVAHPVHGVRFKSTDQATFFATKIDKFNKAIEPIRGDLPRDVVEDLPTNLSAIQAVIRKARNVAGHPVAATLSREQVYIHLHLFIPLVRQMMHLRQALDLIP